MEEPDISSNGKLTWIAWITTVGMIIFGALYFFKPKTVVQTQTVSNTVTNTIPANIPQDYLDAAEVCRKIASATYVSQAQALFKMRDIRAVIAIDADTRTLISDDEVKAAFELTLRRNGIPVNPDSINTVTVAIDGLMNPDTYVFAYSLNCDVDELQIVARGGEFHKEIVRVWLNGYHGTVGKNLANDALKKAIETQAELFANDFLNSNPQNK